MNNDNLYITNANDYEVDPILNRNNPSRRPITGTDPAARTGIAGKIKNMFNRNDHDNDYNRDWNNRSFTRDPHHYEYTTDDKIRYDWERANKGNDLVYNPGNSNFRQDYWDSRDYSDTRNPFARSMFDKNLQYRNDRSWYNDNWNYSNRPFVSDKVMNRDTDYDNRNWNDSYYDNDYNRKPSFLQKIKGRVGSSGYSGDYTDRRDRYAGVPRNYNRRGSNSSSSDDSDDENRNYSRRNRPTMMEKIKRTIPGMGMGGSRSYDRGYGMNDWNRSYGMNDWNRSYGMNDWNRGYDNNDWHRNYWSRNPDWGYQPSLFDRLSSRFGGNYQYPMDYYNASASSSQYGNQTWYPNIDIFEDMSKNMYCFCVELPGVNKNELHVDIDNERLIVWGEKTSSIHTPSTLTSAPGTNPPPLPTSTTSSISSQVHKSECPFGRFYRTVVLPRGVDSTQVQAWLENGILYINVPKPIQTLRPGINISDTRPMTSTSAMSSNIPSSNVSSNLNQQGKTYQGMQDSNAFSLGSQGGKSTQPTTQTTATKLY